MKIKNSILRAAIDFFIVGTLLRILACWVNFIYFNILSYEFFVFLFVVCIVIVGFAIVFATDLCLEVDYICQFFGRKRKKKIIK